MGNLYANISLRTSDVEAVVRTVTALDRHAYVAREGDVTYVFDEQCDEQDLEDLERLAIALSKELACVAFAACNHDDDVLVILLADRGAVTDRYDSNPGYFDGAPGAPSGGDAEQLCGAFGVPDNVDDVEDLLRRRNDDVGPEVGRHAALCRLLGVSERLGIQGYRYLSQGELVEELEPAMLRLVAPAADRHRPPSGRSSKTRDTASSSVGADNMMAAMQAEPDLFWNSYALALHDADIPERFVSLFGIAQGNGHLLFTRLLEYVMSRKLSKNGWVHADDLLADFLGQRKFVPIALARLLRGALGIPPLGEDQIAAFNRGDRELLLRIASAVDAAHADAERRGSDPSRRARRPLD
jgi:hypothetical protein